MARKTGQPYKARPATLGLSEFKNVRIGLSTINLRFYGNQLETLINSGAIFSNDGALVAKVESISEGSLVLRIGVLNFEPGLPNHWASTVRHMQKLADSSVKATGKTKSLAEMFEWEGWSYFCQMPALMQWTIDEINAARMIPLDASPEVQTFPGWKEFVTQHARENPSAKRKQGGPRRLTAKSEFTISVASSARNMQLDFPELTENEAIELGLAKLPKQADDRDCYDVIQKYLRKMKRKQSA